MLGGVNQNGEFMGSQAYMVLENETGQQWQLVDEAEEILETKGGELGRVEEKMGGQRQEIEDLEAQIIRSKGVSEEAD